MLCYVIICVISDTPLHGDLREAGSANDEGVGTCTAGVGHARGSIYHAVI